MAATAGSTGVRQQWPMAELWYAPGDPDARREPWREFQPYRM